MNRRRRAELRKATDFLGRAQYAVLSVLDDGPDFLDQMSEEEAKLLTDAIKELRGAYDDIEQAVDCVDEAMA